MATPTGIAAAARQAASGFALRALPRRKTYTTSWDINIDGIAVHGGEQALAAVRHPWEPAVGTRRCVGGRPQCSGCRPWSSIAVLTLSGIKQSFDTTSIAGTHAMVGAGTPARSGTDRRRVVARSPLIDPLEHHPPWGKTDGVQLVKILRSLTQVLMPPAAADLVRYQMGRWPRDLPEGRQRWACQTFRVDDGATGTMMLAAPDHLRHWQFVLGLLRLLLAPSAKGASASAAIDEADRTEIPAWQLARWPSAAAQWVSPGLTSNSPPVSRRRTPIRTTPRLSNGR